MKQIRLRTEIIAAAVLVFAGCNRYERVYARCVDEPPIGNSAIAWEQGGIHGSIAGSVIALADRKPLRAALVELDSIVARASTDSIGHFSFENVNPGNHSLRIRRIGYYQARSSITMGSAGVQVLATLGVGQFILDGCGYGFIEKRKPWWKP